MGSKVFVCNPLLDITLPTAFSSLALYVLYYLYMEGKMFNTLIASIIIVSVLVWIIEESAMLIGKWASSTFLNDSKHKDPLSKIYTLKKFKDQFWQLIYHSVFSLWEYRTLQNYNWFIGEQFYIPWGVIVDVPRDVQLIFIVQIALWLYQAYRHVLVNQRKKDYYEVFIHHIVTLSLCCCLSDISLYIVCAYFRWYRHGLIVLYLHDVSDILVDLLKMLNLCRIGGKEDFFALEIEYAVTILVWVYQRLYFFPSMIYQRGVVELLNIYAGTPVMAIIKKEWIYAIQFVFLAILYILHWYWFILLVRLGYRALIKERDNIEKISKEGYEGDSDDSDSPDSSVNEKRD